MATRYNITLNAREALVVRVALRHEMERQEGVRQPSPAWKDVHTSAADVLVKLQDPANRSEVDDKPKAGLCGNREDHEPHIHRSTVSGNDIYCHADQSRRLPYAMERKGNHG